MKHVEYPAREDWDRLSERPYGTQAKEITAVEKIIEKVRASRDEALREYTRLFDRCEIDTIEVPAAKLEEAGARIPNELKRAIETAKANIERFHASQRRGELRVTTAMGVTCWRKEVPIEKVGLYIPGGSAPLFSTLLMLGVPAKLAGCREIVLCTPPSAPTGYPHDVLLYVAHLLGLERVFRVGGAQAIAAMAFGTETVPAVYKIFGPGNQYVTLAKERMSRYGVAIDLVAGPSELAVLADESAVPKFVAADLISQAEHGVDSQVIVITTSRELLKEVDAELERQTPLLPRKEIISKALEKSVGILVRDTDEGIELANHYAPEHLILAVESPEEIAHQIRNAGSVFLGNFSPETIGDYASGTNHTLPTNGWARSTGGVSLESFVKCITFQRLTAEGLMHLGSAVETMSEAEELLGHKQAIRIRLASAEIRNDLPANPESVRVGRVVRKTLETAIEVSMTLDGKGSAQIATGIGFFDHMLEQIARHSKFDLIIRALGDLHIDEHHTIEDTALAMGEAFAQALGDKRGIDRYAFLLPMDDALAHIALDLSGRSWLVWDAEFTREKIGEMPTEMFYHFFKSFCDAAKCNLNVKATGENEHHKIESIFKGFGRVLGQAAQRHGTDDIPSTKGTL